MLVKLKAPLARRPLAGFFVLVGAVFVVALAATRTPSFNPIPWINRFSPASVMVAGLIALLCCWAISGPRSGPPRRFDQLVIVVAVVLLVMTALCVEAWLLWRIERAAFGGARGSPGAYVMPMPSLAQWIHRALGSWVSWLRALVAGLVLAGVVSPFTEVRRLSQRLVAWRGPQVWPLVAVALLVPAACAAVARIGGSLAPLAIGGSVELHDSLGYAFSVFVVALLVSMPLVFAWYGFVGERLAQRVSPLVAALVIGLAVVLPFQLAVRVAGVAPWSPDGGWQAISVLGGIAVAVPAVWLVRAARGSLIPTAVLLAAIPAGTNVVALTSSSMGVLERIGELYPCCLIVAAVLFALGGRMWRRTEAPAPPLAPDEPNPASGGYEAPVGGVGAPL
jgi:hypothetical protein